MTPQFGSDTERRRWDDDVVRLGAQDLQHQLFFLRFFNLCAVISILPSIGGN